jgi:hypothetical protein
MGDERITLINAAGKIERFEWFGEELRRRARPARRARRPIPVPHSPQRRPRCSNGCDLVAGRHEDKRTVYDDVALIDRRSIVRRKATAVNTHEQSSAASSASIPLERDAVRRGSN